MENNNQQNLSSGQVVLDKPHQIEMYRLIQLRMGLRMEAKGMRLTAKAPTCLSIVKKEYGLKGNRAKVLAKFETFIDEFKAAAEQGRFESWNDVHEFNAAFRDA